MTVLGIDPGLHRLGFAIVKSKKSEIIPVSYGLISTAPELSKQERLAQIYDDMSLIIDKYHPDIVALETLIFAKNTKTATTVSEVRGVLLLLCEKKQKPVSEFAPLQVKTSVTGYGRAGKSQIQSAVKLILSLKEVPSPDDVADALAVAICALNNAEFQKRLNG
jgi:crossover junction endodeoxyribonuclease RuvC